MNIFVVLKVLGIVLIWEAVLMIPSLMIAVYDGSYEITAFIISILIIGIIGFILYSVKTKGQHMRSREGFASVALCWLLMSMFGALPFYLSGAIPSYIDSLFETASGFTTTGASILTQIEGLPRGILFWRSFTHWIGGMGVLVFTLALIPAFGARSVFLMRAESPGPTPGKLVPKISDSAKILYMIYTMMTIVEIVLLILARMPVYDAFIHAFGTAGTGGFSNMNLSVGAYQSPAIEWIIAIFMFLFGVNFTLYHSVLLGNWKNALKNEEFMLYSFTVTAAILLIFVNILPQYGYSLSDSIRHSAFQVSSIVTTTGFATVDFNLWPMFSKCILLVLMFAGACAGSTGGGIKFVRVLLLFKSIKYEMKRVIHPRSVNTIKMDGKTVDDNTMSEIMVFVISYIVIIIFAVLIVSLDNFDFVSTFSAVLATISNIGPGIELVGPMGNYAGFSVLSKLVLTACMIIGRLEIMPILVLFTPAVWKKQ